jgi:hypothetical protein
MSQIEETPIIILNKKYRSKYYNAFDSNYAKKLSEIYYSCHNQETINKFNIFSENLMNEPSIDRNCLLDAIEEYQETRYDNFQLNVRFINAAWNLRLMGFGC